MQRSNEIELEELNRNQNNETAKKVNTWTSLFVGLIDSADLTAIFTLFLRQATHRFLEETGKYFMFPIAAAAGLIQAALKWWEAYLNGGKSRTIAEASIETLGSIGITVAVVGILVAPLLFAHITPYLFAAIVGGKTLWNAGSAIFYLAKAIASPENRSENLKTAGNLAIASVAGIFATAAVTAVFMLAHAALAPLGVVAGGIFTCYLAYTGIKMWMNSRKKNQPARVDENTSLLGAEKKDDRRPAPDQKLGQGATLTKSLTGGRTGSPANRIPAPAPTNPAGFVDTDARVSEVGTYGNKKSAPVAILAPEGQRLAKSL